MLELVLDPRNQKKSKKVKKNIRTIDYGYYEPFLIQEYNTGYNSRHAYGYATRKVNQSRGGREGNMAFIKDQSISYNNHVNQSVDVSRIMRKYDIDLKML